MADIRIPDDPLLVDSAETYTGTPVTDLTIIKIGDLINFLSFYARRSFPYMRYSGSGPAAVSFPYPTDGLGYSTRYATVIVGVRKQTNDTAGPVLKVSSTTYGGISASSKSTNIYANPGGIVPGVHDVTDTEEYISYFVEYIDITEGQTELIDFEVTAGTIDGFGIWELPPGTEISSLFGGRMQNATKIDESVGTNVNNFYPGANIKTADVAGLITDHDTAWGSHGRIFFVAHDTVMTSNSTGGAYTSLPVNGIYFPPHQPKSSQTSGGTEYINIKAAVFASTNAGTGQLRLTSENLSYSGTAVTWTDTNGLWRPFDSDDDTTWVASTAVISGRADASGDWISVDAGTTGIESSLVVINKMILWVEESA